MTHRFEDDDDLLAPALTPVPATPALERVKRTVGMAAVALALTGAGCSGRDGPSPMPPMPLSDTGVAPMPPMPPMPLPDAGSDAASPMFPMDSGGPPPPMPLPVDAGRDAPMPRMDADFPPPPMPPPPMPAP